MSGKKVGVMEKSKGSVYTRAQVKRVCTQVNGHFKTQIIIGHVEIRCAASSSWLALLEFWPR